MNYEEAIAKIKAAAERKNKRMAKGILLGLRKGKVKKIPKAKIRRRLIKKLDIAFSLLVRAIWPTCFFPGCGKPTKNCFHFFTRAKYSIRWDLRNAVGSCCGHNILYEQDQAFIDDVRIWFVARWGQPVWDQLKFDGNQIAKYDNDALQNRLNEIEAEYAKLTPKID